MKKKKRPVDPAAQGLETIGAALSRAIAANPRNSPTAENNNNHKPHRGKMQRKPVSNRMCGGETKQRNDEESKIKDYEVLCKNIQPTPFYHEFSKACRFAITIPLLGWSQTGCTLRATWMRAPGSGVGLGEGPSSEAKRRGCGARSRIPEGIGLETQ